MSTIVVMPGGFHPFHAGHASLYQAAVKAFPGADVYVAATNDQSERPFPFKIKEKLAKVAGIAPGHFVQVKSPFQAKEITQNYDPENDVLIFVRSEKDRTEQPIPGGKKKDGSPSYFQLYTGTDLHPFSKHAYIEYLPTVEFGPGITSASEIRAMWPKLNEKRKTAMVMSLYPATQKNPKLAANVVKLLDAGMGVELEENLSRRGFLGGLLGASLLGGVAKAADSTDSNRLIATVNIEGESKEFDLTGKFKGDVRSQLKQAAKFLTNFLEDRDINFSNLELHYQGAVLRTQNTGSVNEKMKMGATIEPIEEEKEIDPVKTVIKFYEPIVNDIHKEKIDDYVDKARTLLHKTDDPAVRSKLIDIFKQGKENPYIQGGIITTVGALLAGGLLSSASKMGLSPSQTNILLQAVLNTVIPTLVSRINGKSWVDTLKYTLASAGIGTSIAALTESESQDYLEEK